MVNKKNEYVSLYKNKNETKEFTTTKTQRVYQRAQSFIYECLQEPEKRDDVLVNTFKSSNKLNPSQPND